MLSESADSVTWRHSLSGHFSVKSLYHKMLRGLALMRFNGVWKARVPLKVRIFMWQAMRGRLWAADQIRKRNGPGSEFCSLCGLVENTDHIIFRCPLARLFWSGHWDWLGVSWAPNNFEDLRPLSCSLRGQIKRLLWFGFSAMCWIMWTTRNKFTIEHLFPNKAADCILKLSILLQQWKSLIKEGNMDVVELLISHVRATANSILSADQAQHP